MPGVERVIGQLERSHIEPVPAGLIHPSSGVSQESMLFMEKFGLSIPARDMIPLEYDEIMDFSKKLRLHFTQIATRHRLQMEQMSLNSFKDGVDNSLLHELAHLQKTEQLRPGSTVDSTINIVAMQHRGKLSIGLNVATRIPKDPFTLKETAEITLAPWRPSREDYYNVGQYFQRNRVTVAEVIFVLGLVKDKPIDVNKKKFIEFLESLLK